MNPELIKNLTSELFSEEYLVKEEYINDIKSYFIALASKVESNDAANALLIDYL